MFAQHNALRHTRRAGGVNQHAQSVCVALCFLILMETAFTELFAGSDNIIIGQIVLRFTEAYKLLYKFQSFLYIIDCFFKLFGEKQNLCFAVVKYCYNITLREKSVNRHKHAV